MKKNKLMCLCLSIILCFSTFSIISQAAELDTMDDFEKVAGTPVVKSAEEIRNRITTTVTIQDAETGEITSSYELKKEDMEIYAGTVDNPEVTVVIDTGEGKLTRDAGQSNSDTFYGWIGNVRITWYDDGTFARLTSAGGDWTRASGGYEMPTKTITYGQLLGTNSRSGSANFFSSYNIAPSWPSGKYGSGHFLGANINGLVNGQWVNITCNYNLY